MRELSRVAKVTHNAPYRHFADKEAVLAAIAEEGFLLLAECGARARAGAGDDARAWLRDLGIVYILFAIDHPHHFRLMYGGPIPAASARHLALAAAYEASFKHLFDAVEACRAEGLFRKSMTASRLAVVAWSSVHGLASLLVAEQLPADARAKEAMNDLVSIFFEGALVAAPRAPPKRRTRR